MEPKNNDKLYVVVRHDLSPGQRAVQGMHSAISFCVEHSEMTKSWHDTSNHLCFLETDEEYLEYLVEKATDLGITHTIFREPDMGNIMTSVAFEPGERGQALCRSLGLALS